jgi:hypothetical protein
MTSAPLRDGVADRTVYGPYVPQRGARVEVDEARPLAVRVPQGHRAAAPDPAHHGLEDAQGKRGRDGGVDGRAPVLQGRDPGVHGARMGGGHHPVARHRPFDRRVGSPLLGGRRSVGWGRRGAGPEDEKGRPEERESGTAGKTGHGGEERQGYGESSKTALTASIRAPYSAAEARKGRRCSTCTNRPVAVSAALVQGDDAPFV